MTDTPNDKPSEMAIQRYDPDVEGGGSRDYYAYMSPDPLGEWIGYDDHLAALAAARADARREALREVKLIVDTLPCMPLDNYPEEARVAFKVGWEECGNCIADNIRSLAPTPPASAAHGTSSTTPSAARERRALTMPSSNAPCETARKPSRN